QRLVQAGIGIIELLVPDKLLAVETVDNLPVRGGRLITDARVGDHASASGSIVSLVGFQAGFDSVDIGRVWRFGVRGMHHQRCECRGNYKHANYLHSVPLILHSVPLIPNTPRTPNFTYLQSTPDMSLLEGAG